MIFTDEQLERATACVAACDHLPRGACSSCIARVLADLEQRVREELTPKTQRHRVCAICDTWLWEDDAGRFRHGPGRGHYCQLLRQRAGRAEKNVVTQAVG